MRAFVRVANSIASSCRPLKQTNKETNKHLKKILFELFRIFLYSIVESLKTEVVEKREVERKSQNKLASWL